MGLRAYHVIFGALFAGALAVGALILPGERERVAMFERDGRMRDALAILERRFAAGDQSSTTVYQLQEIYLHYGDLKRAREMLELMVTLRPRDATAQRRLAGFYKQIQDEPAYIAALRRRLELRYAPSTCTELVGLVRQKGDHDAEIGALQTCWQKGYRQTEDMIRFATLLAERNEGAQAAQVLRTVDDRLRLRSNRERQMLFQLLVETDQPREAQRRAVRWLLGNRNDAFGLALIDMLAVENRHDDALQLARDAGEPGGSLSLAVAELMLDRAEIQAAQTYLRGWLVDGKLDRPDIATRFVLAALDADAPMLAFEAATRFGLDKLGSSELVPLAESLGASGRRLEFDTVRQLLPSEVIAENPLLGAAVELNAGGATRSRALLSEVRVDQLDEWRFALWSRLIEQANPQAARPQPPVQAEPSPAPQRNVRRARQSQQKQATVRRRPAAQKGGEPKASPGNPAGRDASLSGG